MDSRAPMFLQKGTEHFFVAVMYRRGALSPKKCSVPFSMTDRLAAIEEKLAHLERAVSELSDVVVRQQRELNQALDRNQRLMDKISALESDVGPSATAHEKPPHY
jgi:SlyX protein